MSPKNLPLLLLVVATAVLAGCSSVPRDIVARIGEDMLTTAEYEDMFYRTRLNRPFNDEEKREFLSTLTDFRVKLKEAEHQGLQNRPDIVDEFNVYRNNLALSLLYEQRLTEPAMRNLYERRLEEVKIQQLMVKWSPGESSTSDTSMTWEKARVIHSIIQASDLPFDSLVALYSEDGAKTRTKGVIGWIIAGTTFPWLDDMVYNLEPGQITPHPLRTVFGYHFFRVLDRKPARQRFRPAHILFRLNIDNPQDTASGMAFMKTLLDTLQRGLATFEELAMRHSQDSLSGSKGGDIGWMTRGTNIESHFEDAMLALQPGEISSIVRTPFGLHIIKLLDEDEPEPYEKQKDNLRRVYRGERFATDFLNFTKNLRKQYHFSINRNVVNNVLGSVDTNATTSTPGWDSKVLAKDRASFLLRTDLGPVTVDEAIRYMKTEPSLQMRRFNIALFDTVALMAADQLLALHEAKDFETTIPEFKRLLQEYRATTLVTHLEEQEIWAKITPDDHALKEWWQARKSEFVFPPRVKIAEIFSYTEKMANIFKDSLYAGYDFGYLASRYTQRTGYGAKRGEWDYIDYNRNDLSRAAAALSVGQIVGPIPFENGFSLIKLLAKDEAREQTWEEARPNVLLLYRNDVAERLRSEWLRELRQRYNVIEYPGNLDAAFPPEQKSGK